MSFDPKTHKYPYPIFTDEHYLVIKKNDHFVFDKDYPFIDRSKGFLFKQFIIRILLRTIVFPMTKIKLGLKVVNKKNLKKYKGVINNGVISISNHVHLFDYLAIMSVIKPIKPYVLVWAPNVRGENKKLVRMVGGIPIPEEDIGATLSYLNHIHNLLDNGGWLHIYPEGSMWEYYMPIRPFKKGSAYIAVSNNKPIMPFGFSYRKAGFIRRKLFKQPAVFTLTVGEPLYPDESLDKHKKEEELMIRSHDEVCRLAGIDPKENIYPPIFNKTKRVDYY